MKTAEDYAKMIESATRLVNVNDINRRTIKEGLESYAKQHAKDFALYLGSIETIVYTDEAAEEDYNDWINQ